MSSSRVHYTGLPAVRNAFYNIFIRRTPMFALTLVAAGYAATEAVDALSDTLWERANRNKLWKHVQPQIEARKAELAAAEEEGGDA
ncbi:hypothetical protein CDCA_CDCA03G1072 [Cyanidium caldarium]|uniref:Cytochrome b-c1 complex subunit 9 n=1 Tax=Cyanidium caldarium TaxID=2771 RepID=A0AAV9IRS4_CYACA|nr:hypothetical protein CDCA_CDCA03G1072 [Cyanidium caldarium]